VKFVALKTPAEWEWFAQRDKGLLLPDAKGIAIYDEDVQVAAVVFDQWTHNMCRTHIAIDNPHAVHRGRDEVYNYIFNTCERGIMIGWVASSNRLVVELLNRLGWVESLRIPDGYMDGDDVICFTYTKDLWLNQRVAA
jgi:hypothetical protein